MASERSKRRDFLSLSFITKSKGSLLSQILTAIEEHVLVSSFCLFIVPFSESEVGFSKTSSHIHSASRGYLFALSIDVPKGRIFCTTLLHIA